MVIGYSGYDGSRIIFNNVTFQNSIGNGYEIKPILDIKFEEEDGASPADEGYPYFYFYSNYGTVIDINESYLGNPSLSFIGSPCSFMYKNNNPMITNYFMYKNYFKFSDIPEYKGFSIIFEASNNNSYLELTFSNNYFNDNIRFYGSSNLFGFFDYNVETTLEVDVWHELKIIYDNNNIVVIIDNINIFSHNFNQNNSLETIDNYVYISKNDNYPSSFDLLVNHITLSIPMIEKVYIHGTNTFNILKFLDPSYEIWFDAGSALTILEDFICNGEPGKLMYLTSVAGSFGDILSP